MPMEAILQWVAHHAYGGVFLLLMFGIIGLPVPDEWLLTFLGYLVSHGDVRFVPAVVCAFLGTTCGISLSYALGRTLGLRILHKYGKYVRITPELLKRTHDWFQRAGKWSLTFGYFVPGIRHLTAYVAGAAELELPQFAVFAYPGGAIWVLTFVSLGYFLGEAWLRVMQKYHRTAIIVTGSTAAIVILFLLVRWIWQKKNKRKKK